MESSKNRFLGSMFMRPYDYTGYSSGLNFIKFLKDELLGKLQRAHVSAFRILLVLFAHIWSCRLEMRGIAAFYYKSTNIWWHCKEIKAKEMKHVNLQFHFHGLQIPKRQLLLWIEGYNFSIPVMLSKWHQEEPQYNGLSNPHTGVA